jgi:hypothetical protein
VLRTSGGGGGLIGRISSSSGGGNHDGGSGFGIRPRPFRRKLSTIFSVASLAADLDEVPNDGLEADEPDEEDEDKDEWEGAGVGDSKQHAPTRDAVIGMQLENGDSASGGSDQIQDTPVRSIPAFLLQPSPGEHVFWPPEKVEMSKMATGQPESLEYSVCEVHDFLDSIDTDTVFVDEMPLEGDHSLPMTAGTPRRGTVKRLCGQIDNGNGKTRTTAGRLATASMTLDTMAITVESLSLHKSSTQDHAHQAKPLTRDRDNFFAPRPSSLAFEEHRSMANDSETSPIVHKDTFCMDSLEVPLFRGNGVGNLKDNAGAPLLRLQPSTSSSSIHDNLHFRAMDQARQKRLVEAPVFPHQDARPAPLRLFSSGNAAKKTVVDSQGGFQDGSNTSLPPNAAGFSSLRNPKNLRIRIDNPGIWEPPRSAPPAIPLPSLPSMPADKRPVAPLGPDDKCPAADIDSSHRLQREVLDAVSVASDDRRAMSPPPLFTPSRIPVLKKYNAKGIDSDDSRRLNALTLPSPPKHRMPSQDIEWDDPIPKTQCVGRTQGSKEWNQPLPIQSRESESCAILTEAFKTPDHLRKFVATPTNSHGQRIGLDQSCVAQLHLSRLEDPSDESPCTRREDVMATIRNQMAAFKYESSGGAESAAAAASEAEVASSQPGTTFDGVYPASVMPNDSISVYNHHPQAQAPPSPPPPLPQIPPHLQQSRHSIGQPSLSSPNVGTDSSKKGTQRKRLLKVQGSNSDSHSGGGSNHDSVGKLQPGTSRNAPESKSWRPYGNDDSGVDAAEVWMMAGKGPSTSRRFDRNRKRGGDTSNSESASASASASHGSSPQPGLEAKRARNKVLDISAGRNNSAISQPSLPSLPKTPSHLTATDANLMEQWISDHGFHNSSKSLGVPMTPFASPNQDEMAPKNGTRRLLARPARIATPVRSRHRPTTAANVSSGELGAQSSVRHISGQLGNGLFGRRRTSDESVGL